MAKSQMTQNKMLETSYCKVSSNLWTNTTPKCGLPWKAILAFLQPRPLF